MVKTSFEETYPWNDSNRWAVTLSVDTMKWVIKTWDEGLVEAESDLESLKSENLTLKGIKEILQHLPALEHALAVETHQLLQLLLHRVKELIHKHQVVGLSDIEIVIECHVIHLGIGNEWYK